MSLWAIENLDDAGEGLFVCEAWSKAEALRIHRKKNKGLKVTSCEKMEWIDLALVTGERGESYYFKRQEHYTEIK
jgi:hypothetical protein